MGKIIQPPNPSNLSPAQRMEVPLKGKNGVVTLYNIGNNGEFLPIPQSWRSSADVAKRVALEALQTLTKNSESPKKTFLVIGKTGTQIINSSKGKQTVYNLGLQLAALALQTITTPTKPSLEDSSIDDLPEDKTTTDNKKIKQIMLQIFNLDSCELFPSKEKTSKKTKKAWKSGYEIRSGEIFIPNHLKRIWNIFCRAIFLIVSLGYYALSEKFRNAGHYTYDLFLLRCLSLALSLKKINTNNLNSLSIFFLYQQKIYQYLLDKNLNSQDIWNILKLTFCSDPNVADIQSLEIIFQTIRKISDETLNIIKELLQNEHISEGIKKTFASYLKNEITTEEFIQEITNWKNLANELQNLETMKLEAQLTLLKEKLTKNCDLFVQHKIPTLNELLNQDYVKKEGTNAAYSACMADWTRNRIFNITLLDDKNNPITIHYISHHVYIPPQDKKEASLFPAITITRSNPSSKQEETHYLEDLLFEFLLKKEEETKTLLEELGKIKSEKIEQSLIDNFNKNLENIKNKIPKNISEDQQNPLYEKILQTLASRKDRSNFHTELEKIIPEGTDNFIKAITSDLNAIAKIIIEIFLRHTCTSYIKNYFERFPVEGRDPTSMLQALLFSLTQAIQGNGIFGLFSKNFMVEDISSQLSQNRCPKLHTYNLLIYLLKIRMFFNTNQQKNIENQAIEITLTPTKASTQYPLEGNTYSEHHRLFSLHEELTTQLLADNNAVADRYPLPYVIGFNGLNVDWKKDKLTMKPSLIFTDEEALDSDE